jgi:hypothetical protein
MRTAILACFTILSLAACSPEPAKQEAPPASTAAPAPIPGDLMVTLTDPSQLSVPAGSPIQVTAVAGGLRLQGAVRNPSPQIKTDGASIAVGAANERLYGGQRIRVTIRARGVDGATGFHAAYSTNDNGNSGWRALPLTATPDDAIFEFIVPAVVRGNDDYIGIVPPDTGAMEVQSIHVQIVSPAGLRN